MSKRAEEKATKYANSVMLSVNHRVDVRDAFWDGHEQAEKDTIERAIKWLKKNWREYVWTTDNGIPHFGHWENDFRKAMEEE